MRGKAGIRPDLGVAEALGGAARGILQEARDALDDRARSDAVAVHEYRKDMKRWRALLRLLAPVLGAEADALRREAGDLARELAPARDVQAALDALADLAKADSALPDAAMARLAARVEAMKMDAEETALSETMRAKLRRGGHCESRGRALAARRRRLCRARGRARRGLPTRSRRN